MPYMVLQVIKLYAWEIPFQRLISSTRRKELDQLKKIAIINAVSVFMWTSVPLMVRITMPYRIHACTCMYQLYSNTLLHACIGVIATANLIPRPFFPIIEREGRRKKGKNVSPLPLTFNNWKKRLGDEAKLLHVFFIM